MKKLLILILLPLLLIGQIEIYSVDSLGRESIRPIKIITNNEIRKVNKNGIINFYPSKILEKDTINNELKIYNFNNGIQDYRPTTIIRQGSKKQNSNPFIFN